MGKTALIKDMQCDLLAEYAHNAWVNTGLSPTIWRLIYLGLSRERNHARLLQLLADTFVEFSVLAPAITLKYMQSPAVILDEWRQKVFDIVYASAMWKWGLSSRRDGGEVTRLEEFEDAELFEYDLSQLEQLIQPILEHYGDIEVAMTFPLVILGYNAKALLPREPGKLESLEYPHFSDFTPDPDYLTWLEQPVDLLGPEFTEKPAE